MKTSLSFFYKFISKDSTIMSGVKPVKYVQQSSRKRIPIPLPSKLSSVRELNMHNYISVVKIDSSPPVRLYQKFERASKSLRLLAQKVC